MYLGVKNKKTGEYKECGYLRKANQVRGFFNDKYEVLNCTNIVINVEDIKELHYMCELLLSLKELKPELAEQTALVLLPPTEGFFFGSQEVDEWYYDNLEETAKITKEILNLKNEDEDDDLEIWYYEWW